MAIQLIQDLGPQAVDQPILPALQRGVKVGQGLEEQPLGMGDPPEVSVNLRVLGPSLPGCLQTYASPLDPSILEISPGELQLRARTTTFGVCHEKALPVSAGSKLEVDPV
jgi:hypothetical protein